MTQTLSGKDIAAKLETQFPGSILESSEAGILVNSQTLVKLAAYLKTASGFELDYLNYVTAVDYYDYFELVYLFTSLKHNHSLVVKTRCYGRENLTVPSLVSLYRGADYQEREINDLLGIKFEGHPNLRPIFLWEGFEGHPLRKDFLA